MANDLGVGQSWHNLLGWYMLILGSVILPAALCLLWNLALTVDAKSLIDATVSSCVASYFVGRGMIFRGSKHAAWVVLAVVSGTLLTIVFLCVAVTLLIAPEYGRTLADIVVSSTMPYPMLVMTVAVIGTGLALEIVSVAFFVPVPRRVFVVLVVVYVSALTVNIFFAASPLIPLIGMAIVAGYYLDVLYGWTGKLFRW
jgi:hypothetical protein